MTKKMPQISSHARGLVFQIISRLYSTKVESCGAVADYTAVNKPIEYWLEQPIPDFYANLHHPKQAQSHLQGNAHLIPAKTTSYKPYPHTEKSTKHSLQSWVQWHYTHRGIAVYVELPPLNVHPWVTILYELGKFCQTSPHPEKISELAFLLFL